MTSCGFYTRKPLAFFSPAERRQIPAKTPTHKSKVSLAEWNQVGPLLVLVTSPSSRLSCAWQWPEGGSGTRWLPGQVVAGAQPPPRWAQGGALAAAEGAPGIGELLCEDAVASLVMNSPGCRASQRRSIRTDHLPSPRPLLLCKPPSRRTETLLFSQCLTRLCGPLASQNTNRGSLGGRTLTPSRSHALLELSSGRCGRQWPAISRELPTSDCYQNPNQAAS